MAKYSKFKTIQIPGHTRADGTKVKPHKRTVLKSRKDYSIHRSKWQRENSK